MKNFKSVTYIWPSGGSENCLQFRKIQKVLLSSLDVRHLWPSASPLPQAQRNDVSGCSTLPFGQQTLYRIFKNIFRKLISQWFWNNVSFFFLEPCWAEKFHLESSNPDPRGAAQKLVSTVAKPIATFYTVFLSQGGPRNKLKHFQNCLKVSFLDMF